MASRFYSEIADLSDVEIIAKSRELRQQLFTLGLEKATARLEKTHKVRDIRRNIARCETKLSQLKKTVNRAQN